jgi:RNA polymerase sigma-70 factor (ECF subfamily)
LILKDLRQLIIDSAAGKQKAMAELYQLFAPKMFGVCLRYSKDHSEAEDNLQEGFLKVFEKIGSFRHEGSFEGWVRRIMVNVALEKFRKYHLLHPVEDMGIYDGPELNDNIISEISAQDLMKIIQELPPRYKMVFNLYVFEGLNHKEIAAQMKISVGTSKSNLARARVILKEKVVKVFGEIENNYSA